ncbi:hypothetical protein VaNZ11_003306, partial [Volvox africanus]
MNCTVDRVIFLEDGVLDICCKLSPQQVLLRHRDGVYTTVLITPDGMLVDWDLHRNRLLRGITILNKRPSRPFQSFLSSLDTQGSSLSEFFSSQVVPAVKTTLSAFYGEEPAAATQPPSHQQGPQPTHAMLVVCIPPATTSGTDARGTDNSADPTDKLTEATSSTSVVSSSPTPGSGLAVLDGRTTGYDCVHQ